MIGIVVVTHGRLAEELVSAARTIHGELPRVAAVSLGWGDDATAAAAAIERGIAAVRASGAGSGSEGGAGSGTGSGAGSTGGPASGDVSSERPAAADGAASGGMGDEARAEGTAEAAGAMGGGVGDEAGSEGTLVLTDMFGGTPTNLSLPYLSEGVEIVTGVSLPMIIKAAGLREGALVEVARAVAEQGRGAIFVASEILAAKK